MCRRVLGFGVASLLLACAAPRDPVHREPLPTSLVLIHTADLHSHLFPERELLSGLDAARGLGRAGQVSEVGGFARVASVIADIRAGAEHSLYLDSGDLIEGTAAYTQFQGEPDLRALSALGVAAVALGNHDLGPGAQAFAEQHSAFATFPVLAANLADNGSELASALEPSRVLQVAGLRIGVIGVANPNSPSGLERADNPYDIELLPTAAAVQAEVDRLRTEVDLVIALSHLGLAGDEALVRDTSGLDVLLGGHQHLAQERALERWDCGSALQAERGCQARRVLVAHSGARGRFVGELDLELAPAAPGSPDGLEVMEASRSLIAISADIPEDPALAALLEPYRAGLHAAGFDTPVAFALAAVERRTADGGDSALGNLVADAMRAATGSDFALLNSSGLRADLPPGALTRAQFIAALPFEDSLSVLTLSGAQLRTLLNQQARVASTRKCQSPIQISGFRLELTCSGSGSTAVAQLGEARTALGSNARYTLVTSAYLANGSSGFDTLTETLARRDLDLDPAQVVVDAVQGRPSCNQSRLPCLDPSRLRDGRVALRNGT